MYKRQVYTDMESSLLSEAKSTRLLPFHRMQFAPPAKEKDVYKRQPQNHPYQQHQQVILLVAALDLSLIHIWYCSVAML